MSISAAAVEEEFKDAAGTRVKLLINNKAVHNNDGAFSVVFNANVSQIGADGLPGPGLDVALKKQSMKRGKNFREREILRALAVAAPHKHIVKLLYSQQRKNAPGDQVQHTLVFRFMPTTLHKIKAELAADKNALDIKLYMWQIFAGLDHLRKLRLIHRDLKTANMLVDPCTGRLQIADFGAAIYFPCYQHLNYNYVVTRPYRPPEMILKTKLYNWMADVWSAGCIFAELYLGKYLFYRTKAEMEEGQLKYTFTVLGVPSIADLEAMRVDLSALEALMPAANQNVISPVLELTKMFEQAGYQKDKNPAELVARILRYAPTERLHGRRLLLDPFFDVLFEPGKRRSNKALVAQAIDASDRELIEGTPI